MKSKNLPNINPIVPINELIKPIVDIFKNKYDKEKTEIKEENETKRKEISADEEKTKTAIKSVTEITGKVLEDSKEIVKSSIDSSIENHKENIKHIERVYQQNKGITEKTLNQYEVMIAKEKEEKTKFLNIHREQNKENLRLSENISILKEEVLELKIKKEIEKKIYTKLYNKQQILIELEKEKKKLAFEISERLKQVKPLDEELNKINIDLEINTSHFVKENIEFEKKIENIEKLVFEYKDIIDRKEYKNILEREKRELNKIEDNIIKYEYKMLNCELRKLTKEKEREPIKSEIQELEKKRFLITLELENEQKLLLNPLLEDITVSNKDLDTDIIEVEIYS